MLFLLPIYYFKLSALEMFIKRKPYFKISILLLFSELKM